MFVLYQRIRDDEILNVKGWVILLNLLVVLTLLIPLTLSRPCLTILLP
jgi:hypothetical protein